MCSWLANQAIPGGKTVSPVLFALFILLNCSTGDRVGFDEADLDEDLPEEHVGDEKVEQLNFRHAHSLLSERQAVMGHAVRAVGSLHGNHSQDVIPLDEDHFVYLGNADHKDQKVKVPRLTANQLAMLKELESDMESPKPPGRWLSISNSPVLLALAGGIGASVGNTGSIILDRDLIRRMKVQDVTVMMLLLLAYFSTLFFSGCLAHRQAHNNSRAKYYADPRVFVASCDSRYTGSFLEAFNTQPRQVLLTVSGYRQVQLNAPHGFHWKDGTYVLAFSFALDLTPWVERGQEVEQDDDPAVGISEQDLDKLSDFLANDKNELAIVELDKRINWDNCDDLALNIKSMIRQQGFDGMLHVHRTEVEEMPIYRNTQWANFLHSKALKVLLALSVFGWIIYGPYMWFRCKKLTIRCNHHINMPVDAYWENISAGLTAQGFRPGNSMVSWPVGENSDTD